MSDSLLKSYMKLVYNLEGISFLESVIDSEMNRCGLSKSGYLKLLSTFLEIVEEVDDKDEIESVRSLIQRERGQEP